MTDKCPRCGSHKVGPSKRRTTKDIALGLLRLRAIRCQQCKWRFFRFRTEQARQVFSAALCLIPALIMGAWFTELHSLFRARELTIPARQESARSMDELLRQRLDGVSRTGQ
jgi:hypothetical protein